MKSTDLQEVQQYTTSTAHFHEVNPELSDASCTYTSEPTWEQPKTTESTETQAESDKYNWALLDAAHMAQIKERLLIEEENHQPKDEIAQSTSIALKQAGLQELIDFDPRGIETGGHAWTKVRGLQFYGEGPTFLIIFLEENKDEPGAYYWTAYNYFNDPVWLTNLPENLKALQTRVFAISLLKTVMSPLNPDLSSLILRESGEYYRNEFLRVISRLLPRTIADFAEEILDQISVERERLFPVDTASSYERDRILYMLVRNLKILMDFAQEHCPDFLSQFKEKPLIEQLLTSVACASEATS
jgi:hypothetical protein